MASYIGAIDQGTTSSRFIVFDRSGRIVSTAQREHEQIYPQPGWVEHDPEEIWRRTEGVIQEAMEARGLRPEDLAAIGITNQRETTVVWHKVESPFTTRLSGRTRALLPRSPSSLRMADRTAIAPKPGFRLLPISAASRFAGFSKVLRAHAHKLKPAICCLAISMLF